MYLFIQLYSYFDFIDKVQQIGWRFYCGMNSVHLFPVIMSRTEVSRRERPKVIVQL